MWLLLAEQTQQQGSLIGMFLPMILVFVVFYFLLIRPQQKQAKKHQQMITEMRAGDEIVTRSGFHGRIISLEEGVCTIELGSNVRVKMNKDQVALVKSKDAQIQKASA